MRCMSVYVQHCRDRVGSYQIRATRGGVRVVPVFDVCAWRGLGGSDARLLKWQDDSIDLSFIMVI